MKYDRVAGIGELPGRLRAGKARADDMDRIVAKCIHPGDMGYSLAF